MTVTQTFTYLPDGFVFEFVRYADGSTACSLMPDPAAAAPVAPAPEAPPLESPPVPAAAPEMLMAAPITKKKRTLMGFIRTAWFIVFTALGGVIDYGIQKYTDLPVPTGTATVIGGVLYGVKRALYPDTVL